MSPTKNTNNKATTFAPGDSILLVHFGDHWLRGSELCLIDMAKTLKSEGYRPVVWCNAPVLEQALHQAGISVYCSPMTVLMGYDRQRWNIANWLHLVRKGCELIERHRPAIVHCNGGAPAQWMNLACKRMKTPQLLQLHAHYGVLKDRVTLGFHMSPYIVGVSHAAIRALINDGVKPRQLAILPNGIDTTALEKEPAEPLKARLGLKAQDTLLLSVGSLIDRKGHKTLFQSLAELNRRGHKTYAAIVGDGPIRAELEAFCEQLSLSNQVFFIGEHPCPFRLMRGDADALVSTSRDEVFGLVLAEANLAKLPVIAPNIPGINSVVIHNKTGFLYTANSPLALANRLITFKNKTQQSALLAKAYWRVKSVYAMQYHHAGLLHHYQTAMTQQQNTHQQSSNRLLAIQLASKGVWVRGARLLYSTYKKLWITKERAPAHG